MRGLFFAAVFAVFLWHQPGLASACSLEAETQSFVRPTRDGFVYVPLPRERFVVVVRGDEVRRVPLRLGVYADVSPDGRWLVTWHEDYSNSELSAACWATGARIAVYDLSRRRPSARRGAMRWERTGGIRATGVRFLSDGSGFVARYDLANFEGDEPEGRVLWRRIQAGRLLPMAAREQVPPLPPAPFETDSPTIIAHPAGQRAVVTDSAVTVAGAAGTLRLPGAGLEDAAFSLDGRTLIALYATFDTDGLVDAYTSRGFVAVGLETGAVRVQWGTHPDIVDPGRVPLTCGTRVRDPAPPLAVRASPSGRARRLAGLDDGAEVVIEETRGAWARIAVPAGWVFRANLQEVCTPETR